MQNHCNNVLHFQSYKIMENVTLYMWNLFHITNAIKSFISVDLVKITFIYIVNNFVLTVFSNIPFCYLPIELNIIKLNIWQC